MRKYFTKYRAYITRQLECDDNDWDKILTEHLDKIAFFQHERLIHLLVMILFALMSLITIIAFVVTGIIGLLILGIMFLGLTIPYIYHYYFMENQTQELFKDYDKILKKKELK